MLDRICVTSTVPDRFNSNWPIRNYITEGFRSLLPGAIVSSSGFDAAPGVIARTEPNLIIAIGSLSVDSVNLYALRRSADAARSILVFWLHDDPYEFDYSYKAEQIADVVFTNDLWALQHYRSEKVFHLPLAGCPTTHFREILPEGDRDIEFFFCGVAYRNRIDFFDRSRHILANYRCIVRGDGWPSHLDFARNLRLKPSAVCDYAQRSLTTLNISRHLNIANRKFNLPASTPGPRTFEVALSGSAQLFVVESLEILEYFREGVEIILIEDIEQFAKQLERAREEPESFVRLARAAQERALAEHTYRNRAARIMECIFGPKGMK